MLFQGMIYKPSVLLVWFGNETTRLYVEALYELLFKNIDLLYI